MEVLIRIAGMIIFLIPIIILMKYLSLKSKGKANFPKHLKIVKANKGLIGLIVAYCTKIFFIIAILSLGVLLIEYFDSFNSFKIFFFTILLYIFFKYFDIKNEK